MTSTTASRSLRTKLVAGTLAGVLTLGVGLAFTPSADAQTDADPDTTEVRERPTPTERLEKRQERLQALVEDGVITQERADEMLERLAERTAAREERQAERQANIAEVAEILGTTADELRADLRAGATLAELAEAAGIDVDVLIDRFEATITERIDAAVTDGKITQEQADERLAELRDRITARVNGERPDRSELAERGFGRAGRGFGRPGG